MNTRTSVELLRLATCERKNGDRAEELRVSLDEFQTEDGKRHRYVSARLWCRAQNDEWRPTKKGTTFRRRELEQVASALAKAVELIDDENPADAAKALELRRQAWDASVSVRDVANRPTRHGKTLGDEREAF